MLFQTKQDFLPQVLLLKEMIQNKNENVEISSSAVKTNYDGLMTDINNTLGEAIGANNEAFSYGAYLDPLTTRRRRIPHTRGDALCGFRLY